VNLNQGSFTTQNQRDGSINVGLTLNLTLAPEDLDLLMSVVNSYPRPAMGRGIDVARVFASLDVQDRQQLENAVLRAKQLG